MVFLGYEFPVVAVLRNYTQPISDDFNSCVIFETDSMNVVIAIHNLRGSFSEFSSIICNIINVPLYNPNFMVNFIKRQANIIAHTLARAVIFLSSHYLFEMLPLCITLLLHNEMILVLYYKKKITRF
jgi:hypothetical protein